MRQVRKSPDTLDARVSSFVVVVVVVGATRLSFELLVVSCRVAWFWSLVALRRRLE